MTHNTKRRVRVVRLPDAAAAVAQIMASADAGQAVAWVRNTVDDVLQAATLLRDREIDPLVFHARFAMIDRLVIEAAVLRRWDKRGVDRPGVLVASQVVEQSLDVDFDVLISDLAPIDLVIQRAGRMGRHDRGERDLILYVVSPDPIDDPPSAWMMDVLPGTTFVYPDRALLWRTARRLFSTSEIVSPSGLRGLIEPVYATNAEIPPGLTRSAVDADRRGRRDAATGQQNVLDVWRGYRPDAGQWDSDVRTPTRLEDRPTVTLRLAVERDGQVVPYAEDTDLRRAWALSEVSVARHRVAGCPVPGGLEGAAERARSQWGRWEREAVERVLLALLVPDGDGYRLAAVSEAGAPVNARYDTKRGLSW